MDMARFAGERRREDDAFRFITAGRFSAEKNHAMMLRAFAAFLGKGYDARLILLGRGELEGELRKLARELDIESRVVFTGFVENVQDHLVNADVFLLSSDYEALPLAVLEAMAAGLPVIATDVGGLRDIVTDNGILVPADDTEAMAQAMEKLYLEKALRTEMEKRATANAAKYDISNTVAGYSKLYCQYTKFQS